MPKKKRPVRYTGQHFTIDKHLITDTISQIQINPNDTIIDIGAGKGFITVHLVKSSNKVIAVENDYKLYKHLRKRFIENKNIHIVREDFRKYIVPKIPFKVVSNIPFGITSDIFKILMFKNAAFFQEGAIILQLEPARKLFTKKVYNPFVIFYHTFFDLRIMYEISPESFLPPPTVKSVLLKITKKQPAFDVNYKEKYLCFISYMLKRPHLPTRTALKKVFRKNQVRELAEKFNIDLNAEIVCLETPQWVNCFLEMLEVVPEKYHPKN
ncbi:23S rRNA (adenine-N6)-dimethyltransferase [Mesonia hippocampi]|uniref:23S rRNA (Adenine-N6)-dimethyltransferase n=1 Tax=Mesonia hippocampi TaxID=1628250 RepID=A0A840EKF4_9FLAO|nr:23S ribosomal RNA methyltransferase Erm [Mesonia hippocampi]MBB4118628.1 23S rRNA (adenine-N6)-dimethyltransferase [Mesonia hippocampi]